MMKNKLKFIRMAIILYLVHLSNRFPKFKKKCNQIVSAIFLLRIKLTNKGSYSLEHLNKIFMINPNTIKYEHKRKLGFSKFKDKGRVVNGDWDLPPNIIKFENKDIYEAFYERNVNHKSWEATRYYKRVLAEVTNGKIKWGCISKNDLDERCKKLDQLYIDIRDNGYKPQNNLPTTSKDLYELDEIAVSIGRSGELLFTDGQHRLAIAKLLDIKEVPVTIVVRHPQWVYFRNEILAHIKRYNKKYITYQPLTHPDLSDIPSSYGDEILTLIKNNLTAQKGTLLDIGANWGYYCHKFEDEGFDCTAVENDPTHIYFLDKLRKAEYKHFKIVTQSIFEYKDDLHFDVILALNIFHHFLKEKKLYDEFISFLQKIETEELFLVSSKYDEPQMKYTYKNLNPNELIRIILENSCLNKFKYLGPSKQGRHLYKLFR
jgi:hypothetical protein